MQLKVCAVCITADRPELTGKAVACFEAQTHEAKRLVIYDTSKGNVTRYRGHFQHVVIGGSAQTIGELRNAANAFANPEEVIVHWDSDEWSHPNRIAEQVALLQWSGADCVGYNDMLFWREPRESWLYTGSILGTSLCYWRRTWERVPFRAQRLNPRHDPGVGEDHDFLLDMHAAGMKSVGVSSTNFLGGSTRRFAADTDLPLNYAHAAIGCDPRMIASIHAGNTSNAYDPAQMAAHPQHWRRVPEWDAYCRSVLREIGFIVGLREGMIEG